MSRENEKSPTDLAKDLIKSTFPGDFEGQLATARATLTFLELLWKLKNSPLVSVPVSAWRSVGGLFTAGLPETRWQKAMLDEHENAMRRSLRAMELAKKRGVNRLDLLPTLMSTGVASSDTPADVAEIISQVNSEFTSPQIKQ